MRTCEVEGCESRHLARGMCNRHYQQWRAKVGDGSVCEIPQCERPRYMNGLCSMHAARARARGAGERGYMGSSHLSRTERVVTRDHLGRKQCSHCHAWKPEDSYGIDRQAPDGKNRWCRQCVSDGARRRKYGLTQAELDALLGTGKCAICGCAAHAGHRGAVVDHDHATARVRGLLCNDCNLMIGHAGDSVARLTAAIAYLGGIKRKVKK